jgi:hypothetical protein
MPTFEMPSITHYLTATFASVAAVCATGVILPLYTWPSDGAWDPVYDALVAYPEVDFNVIVNPNSGPGNSCKTFYLLVNLHTMFPLR